MWTLIKTILTKWALLKLLLRGLGSLGWLIPVAFILKFIGLPMLMLMLLLLLALPIFIVLALIGLPFILVIVFGGMLIAGLFLLLKLGLVVLTVAVPILLVYWVVRWFLRNGKSRDGEPATDV
jgi:hypothetical protein